MPSGVYVKTEEHKRKVAQSLQQAWDENRRRGKGCPPNCTCGRHRNTAVKCKPGCTCARHINSGGGGSYRANGGDEAEVYAKILVPAGFVREHRVNVPGSTFYRLDFAHVEAKVNIELDGPGHNFLGNADRDRYLRSKGWKVIRIAHEAPL